MVEKAVMDTLRAVFPLARKVQTFDVVPPGTQPMRMMPTLRASGSGIMWATDQPTSGIMQYCASTPTTTGFGWRAIMVKSGMDRVMPMPSMVTASSGVM